MIARLFFNPARQLRNGWWVLAFYLALGASIIGYAVLSGADKGMPVPWQLLLVLGLTLLFQALRRKPFSEISGPANGYALACLAAGMALGAALMALPALLLWFGGALDFTPTRLGPGALASAGLSLLLAAVLEELVFRGFVFRRLADGLGDWPALLITSAFFVLTHMDNPHLEGSARVLAAINIFAASLLFGFALLRSGGLALPIGLHFMANFTQGPLLGFGVSGSEQTGLLSPQLGPGPAWLHGGAFGLEASLPGLLCVSILAVLVMRWRQ